jgi:HD-GYP domain-containing protein (c-di-GMP phosphodiesterase class II)
VENYKNKNVRQVNINSNFTKPDKSYEKSYIITDKRFFNFANSLNFNLYKKVNPTQMSIFLQSNTTLDKEKQQKLQKVEQIYIDKKEKNKYESFIEDNLQNIIQDKSLPLDERTEAVYTSSSELVDSLYSNPDALENAKRSEKIVTPILDSIIHNENTISSYMKIIEYDYYTHTHSLNVSIYSLSLGAELNLDEKSLKILGQAALLHDLGKSKINHEIVNKNGKLTNYEFEQMKMHPALGYDTAMSIGIDNKLILDGIRHHHEKLNGMGYPDGLKGSEITLFPRIICICDVFDALSTRRSYKDAMKSYDALMIMKNQMNEHLDMKILNIFIKMLHK